MTYVFGLVLGDKMSGLIEQGECPVTFLVNNSRELPSVICPHGARFPREALLTAKGHILNGDCRDALVRKKVISKERYHTHFLSRGGRR